MKIRFKKTKISWSKQAGFVSLLALLLANVFLLIGLSVYAISIKELSLSFGGRESTFAFYASDGGMECALYWDIQHEAFATTTTPAVDEITCNLKTIKVNHTSNEDLEDVSSFNFSLDEFGKDVSHPCVEVTVTKRNDMKTEIISKGRNNCDISDSRRVERAWRVIYE